ncbi:two-component system, NarL family, invasion response regulator UvrY [Aromatoleum tolulyticum]|uniref:Two-component system, NarL family, invasion response regulator UvrY n=1 Tax=Aromatoleum tolulyticum TaxID=34027 RepID=A0A1N7B1G1_9RHOO|nr:response regulator transcription factor [Aromatoleum tolulyticum]SIR45197.1 two-component system, NarL family, invasion response regulator UvrY [Aromatoleum tolulyticum]
MPCLTVARPIEVLLVDDQRAILAGVSALVESEGKAMQVSGCATTGRQALDLARRLQPDVIVLDAELGGEDGLALITQLRNACCATIIVFTCHCDAATLQRSLALGAARLVTKTAPGAELLAAIVETAEVSG